MTYSDADSPAKSSATFPTSSRLETRVTLGEMLSSQASITSIMDGYTDDQRKPNDSALDDEEPTLPTLPTLPSRPQSRLQQGYSDLDPPPLSDNTDEDQPILSAMEAEKAASGDAGDMDEALRVVDDPREQVRQQRVQQAWESA
jgi:hypothetical protein